MISQENRNLILTYVVTLGIAIFLIVVIVNFNSWFFPNDQLQLSTITPASRGMISEKDLRFGVLSDQKFTSLVPILTQDQLAEQEQPTPGVTTPAKPSTKSIELRRGNPFLPF